MAQFSGLLSVSFFWLVARSCSVSLCTWRNEARRPSPNQSRPTDERSSLSTAAAGAQQRDTEIVWYSRSAEEVAALLGADPATGLTRARAAELLARDGPNALPEEKPPPGWRRFLDQYRSYMQIILVVAAVVSLAIEQWSTAGILVFLTVLNAVVGLSQEGKAESAMNTLRSMMKATARVRRDGNESVIPGEELVVGDLVLLTAGDQVPADGRVATASALQIDESALTGESTPAGKNAATVSGEDLAPGDQTDMAFMHRPVTHGSGTMLVTADGPSHRGRADSRDAVDDEKGGVPADQGDEHADIVDRGCGRFHDDRDVRARPLPGPRLDALFVSAVTLAISAIPEALPTVTQVILSLGSVELAKHNAIVKDLPSVETLGFTSAVNSDKTGTLTMNQMTVVEVVARPTITQSRGRAIASRVGSSTPRARRPQLKTPFSRTCWPTTPNS